MCPLCEPREHNVEIMFRLVTCRIALSSVPSKQPSQGRGGTHRDDPTADLT